MLENEEKTRRERNWENFESPFLGGEPEEDRVRCFSPSSCSACQDVEIPPCLRLTTPLPTAESKPRINYDTKFLFQLQLIVHERVAAPRLTAVLLLTGQKHTQPPTHIWLVSLIEPGSACGDVKPEFSRTNQLLRHSASWD